MALAHLEWLGSSGAFHDFGIDLGSNRFYRYAVGGTEMTRRYGMDLLTEPTHVSTVHGPLPESSRGRATLTVPADLFDRDNRHVQLMSYRTQALESPTVSSVVPVPSSGTRFDGLPPELALGAAGIAHARPVRYRSRRPVSEAMFLEAIVAALPAVLPAVAPLAAQLLPLVGRAASGVLAGLAGGGGSATAGPAGDGAGTRVTAEQVADLVRRLLEAVARPPGAPAAQAEAQAVRRRRSLPPDETRYSQAAAVPLAALLPLLTQVLTPETVQTLLKVADPNKLLGTTIEGIKAVGRLGIQSAEQDLRHTRELHPAIDDPVLQQLLTSMSASLSAEPPLRASRSVTLHIADGVTHVLGGRPRLLYRRMVDLVPRLSVETPRPILQAVLDVRLKDRDTLEVLHHERSRLTDVRSGPLAQPVVIPASRLAELPPGEYLLCATLRWRTAKGDVVGADRRQLITLMGDTVVDRLEPGGELVPLNDVQRHRDFWHEVWQADLTEHRRRLDVRVRYLVVVESARGLAGRLSTEVAERRGDDGVTVRVRSGNAIAVDALNALLPELGRHQLTADQLDGLADPDVRAYLGGEATGSGRITGRPGRTASVWVYPEVRLARLTLQRATAVDPSGQVTELAAEDVELPVPAVVHVIGTRSE